MDHPAEETLKRFALGKASREESRAVVAHLLKRCEPCARKLKQLMEPDLVPPGFYEAPLGRFDQGLIETLESSISPGQTLREVLRGMLLEPPEEEPRKKR